MIKYYLVTASLKRDHKERSFLGTIFREDALNHCTAGLPPFCFPWTPEAEGILLPWVAATADVHKHKEGEMLPCEVRHEQEFLLHSVLPSLVLSGIVCSRQGHAKPFSCFLLGRFGASRCPRESRHWI